MNASVFCEPTQTPRKMGCEMSDLCQTWLSKRYLDNRSIVCALPGEEKTRRTVSLSGAFRSSPTDTPTTGSHKSSYVLDIGGQRQRHSTDRGSLETAPLSHHSSLVNRVFSRRRTVDDLNKIVLQKVPLSDYFSEFEKDVLLSTWAVLNEEANKHSAAVFTLAGQMFPGLRNLFDIPCANTEKENCESEAAKRHREAYMKMINGAIECLEYPREDFYDDLLVAGAHYATIPGMKTEYFKVNNICRSMTLEVS
uniref:Globin family profile domain-containing protein n=1 Tax=Schistocephalus solidus TaxID=70667 RepID=A0A0V0J9N2_SCHSO